MSRRSKLRLIPSHLPLIRDKLAEYERVALKEEMAAHSQYERSMEAAWNFADNLAVAQLWWISRDMTALAEDTVRAGDFPKSEAPAQSGLIFFDGDVQMVRFPVTDDATGRKVGDAHVSALFWQCDGNGDIELMGFTDHPCALKECDAKSFSLPVIRFANGIFNEHVGGFRWFGDLLRAVWALSAEPHICEAKPAKPDMAHPLPQRFDPEIRKVKMLVLRENLHRPGRSAGRRAGMAGTYARSAHPGGRGRVGCGGRDDGNAGARAQPCGSALLSFAGALRHVWPGQGRLRDSQCPQQGDRRNSRSAGYQSAVPLS